MRLILSMLATLLLLLVIFLAVPLLLLVLAVALLLGIGSVLTRFFAVSTFEATLIATLVGIPLVWFYLRFLSVTGLFSEIQAIPAPEPEPPSLERLIQPPHWRGRSPRRKRPDV